jgi:hypothetical protein
MSQNIKLNPFNMAGLWNNEGLDAVITAFSGGTIVDLADKIATYSAGTVLFNASQFAKIDLAYVQTIIANTVNMLSADSWCEDCCNNTMTSFEKMKATINKMGVFSDSQLIYINQIIGMPCNYNVSDFEQIVSQLETSVIVDHNLSGSDKAPVLLLIAIAKYSYSYWQDVVSSSTGWDPYLTPAAPLTYLRPLWLSNILGALVAISGSIRENISNPQPAGVNLTTLGMIGGITGSSSYIIFK